MDDNGSEHMSEDTTDTEVSKPEKPRGKCTGCAFSYQLGTARTGEHKGQLVIRKHNSRTGPGLCDGAQQPPESATAEPTCEQCEDDPDYCSSAPHENVVGVAPGGMPIVADPFTAPVPVDVGMTDDAHTEAYGHPVSNQDVTPGAAPDPFTAPAPASDIPESTTTVSGQPEPDRDQYGRYMLPVGGKRQPATRATTFAKLGANTKAIEAWNERNVIRGLTLRPDLLMLANGLEVKRDRNDLNSIASQAKDAAGSKVAANIGTAYHAFSERLDAGLMTMEDVPPQYRNRVQQYLTAVARAGLTTRPEWIERTTAVRADQVGAPLPVAGTLDRIFRLPDGSLVIGDLKTGSDLSYGEMEIEVQLALYAHGVNTHGLFDWNTKTWQPVEAPLSPDYAPVKVRTDIAIVVHLPADGDGCTLYVADIERGWRDAQRLGPLQASLKEKKRFRTLMLADLHGPLPVPEPGTELHRVLHPMTEAFQAPVPAPVLPERESDWNKAKALFSSAPDQTTIAQLYQYAMDSGKFHTDQLAVLVGIGKDRLNALALRG